MTFKLSRQTAKPGQLSAGEMTAILRRFDPLFDYHGDRQKKPLPVLTSVSYGCLCELRDAERRAGKHDGPAHRLAESAQVTYDYLKRKTTLYPRTHMYEKKPVSLRRCAWSVAASAGAVGALKFWIDASAALREKMTASGTWLSEAIYDHVPLPYPTLYDMNTAVGDAVSRFIHARGTGIVSMCVVVCGLVLAGLYANWRNYKLHAVEFARQLEIVGPALMKKTDDYITEMVERDTLD